VTTNDAPDCGQPNAGTLELIGAVQTLKDSKQFT